MTLISATMAKRRPPLAGCQAEPRPGLPGRWIFPCLPERAVYPDFTVDWDVDPVGLRGMAMSLIICVGMYRSGSTWQYEVVSHLVESYLGGKRLGFIEGQYYECYPEA